MINIAFVYWIVLNETAWTNWRILYVFCFCYLKLCDSKTKNINRFCLHWKCSNRKSFEKSSEVNSVISSSRIHGKDIKAFPNALPHAIPSPFIVLSTQVNRVEIEQKREWQTNQKWALFGIKINPFEFSGRLMNMIFTFWYWLLTLRYLMLSLVSAASAAAQLSAILCMFSLNSFAWKEI